jgi:membrane protease subunit (stomatin/prohibitin family)
MGLMDFIKKQFIDILEWTESGDGTLAWRYPMAGNEIQYGGSLTGARLADGVFVNEGKIADVFGPGRYTLTTATLPVLTYLQNWDKLFQSPFKSDVYFFSTRIQVDQRWGTTQPVTIRDKDFGAVRLRAFGNYSYRIADPKLFTSRSPARASSTRSADLDGQLRALMLQHISDAVAGSGLAFLDLAANQVEFANQLQPGHHAGVRAAGPEARSRSRCRTSRCPRSCRRSSTRRSAWAWSATTWASSCSTRPRSRCPSWPKARATGGIAATRWAWGPASRWAR